MPAHPKPEKKPKRKGRKVSSAERRKILCKQLEGMVKAIIFWRDGQECVQKLDSGCGNGLMWGHYIAQGQSAWLRYDLGNVFVQCGNHNLRDYNGDKSYATWFNETFGTKAAKYMDLQKFAHSGGKQRTVQELEEMLTRYDALYQNRFYVEFNIKELIREGYYGEIIKEAWLMKGRL